MNKFIIKTLLFSLPIAFLFFFALFFYATDKGDLIRVGYLIDKGNYRSIFKNELEQPLLFSKVSTINQNKPQKFTVLTIGDSFSEQFGFGYKNYLAKNTNTSVLHLDGFLSKNPLESVYGILNGDVLKTIKVDFIILQSVEREIVVRAKKVNADTIITFKSINQRVKKYNLNLEKVKKIDEFSSNRIIKFPVQNIRYLLDDNAYDSDTYKVETKEKLFSVATNDLLFLSSDLNNIKTNNDLRAIGKLNTELNILSKKCKEKGITLIVLASPDKFDFYYDSIVDKKKYPKPMFFERFEKFNKEYQYLNSKKILQTQLKNKKDVYFYDDTHWSPWASQVLATELQKIISKKDNNSTIN